MEKHTKPYLNEKLPLQQLQVLDSLIEVLIKPHRLQRELFFALLLILMRENDFQQIKGPNGNVIDISDYILSTRKKNTDVYEATFVLNNFQDLPIIFLAVPLADVLVLNAVITSTNQAYAICLEVSRFVLVSDLGIPYSIKNRTELTKIITKITAPVKSCIFNLHNAKLGTLLSLPGAVMLRIILKLPIKNVLNLSETCKTMNCIVKEDRVWYCLYKRDFAEESKYEGRSWFDVYSMLYVLRRKSNKVHGFQHWDFADCVRWKDRIEAKHPTPMQEIDEALKACTFGRFHIRILGTALVGFVGSVLVSNSTAYLLPNAECDLNMNLVQKGMLNAVPYVGMLLSSLIAGFLTDMFGRKLFLVNGYGGIFIFTLIAGSSQTYELLLTAKFFEGIFFAASFSPTVTYTSEFCHKGIRDRVMLAQSSFAAFSQVLIAAMSWAILTNSWTYSLFGGYIVLNTWNFYLYLMSLWSLTACTLYTSLPESPKYLITQNRYDEARDIIVKVYVTNTGKAADTFPFPDLWKSAKQQVIDERPENGNNSISHQLMAGFYNIKPMFQMPLVMPLALISSMSFMTLAVSNVLRLWFPQLSTVVEHYSVSTNYGDLCVMLDAYTEDLRNLTSMDTGESICVPHPSGVETYINSMIVGTVCVLPYPLTGFLVNKVGKKPILLCAGVLCVCATLALRWANSKVAVVTLFAFDCALSLTMTSLLQALTVETFPTTMRTLAVSIIMLTGRIGTLCGNVTFPVFLNMGCVVPFFGFSGLMVVVTTLSVFLPAKKQ